MTASAPNSHRSVNQNRPTYSWSALYYNTPESSWVARTWPLCRQSPAPSRIAALWLLVPEGSRRRLAGGKAAPAGAAPGCHGKCAMPQRGIGEVFFGGRLVAARPPHVASGSPGRWRSAGIPRLFFDAPLGHRATQHRFRGRRPLARTCPRLISSGVPPGLEPGGHASPERNQRRGIRPQLSQEDQESVAGLQEVGSQTGSRWGLAENLTEEVQGQRGGADSSGGDAGGEGGE